MFLLTLCWLAALLFAIDVIREPTLAVRIVDGIMCGVLVFVGILCSAITPRWTPKPPGLHWHQED